MPSWRRQTRLLLWKDYLIRKRKLVSLTGVVWATLVVLSLVAVRKNIDTQDLPTCQYAARALPSAGMLAFLQSFICNINNECLPLDQYQEIPLYEDSRIRQLERQFSPLLYNETILDAAEVMPDALKLVATLATAIDDPDIHQIGRNGLHLRDLFINADRVKRYLAEQLSMDETVVDDIMAAEINFQGLFNASMEECNVATLSALLEASPDSLQQLSAKICSLPQQEIERLVMPLLAEINYRKFFNMIGKVVSEARWMGGAAAAALRMFRLENYVPAELTNLLVKATLPRAYFNLTIIKSFMDLFEPTYGETDTYKTVRGVSDVLVDGIQWLYNLLQRPIKSTKSGRVTMLNDAVSLVFKGLGSAKMPLSLSDISTQLSSLRGRIQDGFEVLHNTVESMPISTANVFSVLSKMGTAAMDLLPKRSQHETLYYLTLLTKLLEGAHATVDINLRMEEIMFNVSRRHPDAVKLLTALEPSVLGETFDALADAERTQMFTSHITNPEQMFCDARRLQRFLRVSRAEADGLRARLCGGAWGAYVTDVVRSFGVYDVKKNINKMASLVIAETIGKDNSADLYNIDHDFSAVRSLVNDLSREREINNLDWSRLFNISEDAELFKVVRGKLPLVKNILITVHGALAHEVVRQNPILEAKITPILIRSSELVTALRAELAGYPRRLVDSFGELYADIVRVLLTTLLDRDKIYNALSTAPADMFCGGETNATRYLVIPVAVDGKRVTDTLCLLTTQLDNTLDGNSGLAKVIISTLHEQVNPMKDVNWVELISQLRDLYSLLEKDFGYVLAPVTFQMNNETAAAVAEMLRKVKQFWFGYEHVDATLHLSLKLGLATLDLLDRRLLQLSARAPRWHDVRSGANAANSFIALTGQVVRLVTAFSANNGSFEITELPVTVNATRLILPNLPQLINQTANIVIADETNVSVRIAIEISDVVAVLNGRPRWPCSDRSLGGAVGLAGAAGDAARGLKLLACAGRALRREWADNAHARTLHAAFSGKPDNTTPPETRIFLKLSGHFDALIRDLNELDRSLKTEVWERSSNETRLSIVDAVKYAVDAFRANDKNSTLFRRVFYKVDTILEQLDSTPVDDSVPVAAMWEQYLKCSNGPYVDDECNAVGRAAWKYTLKFMSTAGQALIEDLSLYFSEVNERNATLLQIFGFTRGTGLYTLYERLPDFVGVLLNSYWDQGFMNQVRRASNSQFWDCAALVAALAVPVGGRVTRADLERAQPYVCPSVLYWISLPRGQNTLLDLVAKTQYFFYNLQASQLNSTFASAYDKSVKFAKQIDEISKMNRSDATFNESVQTKFNKMVDGLLLWNISKDDASYRLFNEVNKKQFVSTVYLTEVAIILNIFSEIISNTNASVTLPEYAIEFSAVTKLLKQRPAAMMEIYFNAITEVLWRNQSNLNIVDALNTMCQNRNESIANGVIAMDKSVFDRFCLRKYQKVHEGIGDALDVDRSRYILKSFVESLQHDGAWNNINPVEFFSNRTELVKSLKRSMKHADDLGIALYVKYLQSALQHQSVILSFLSGEDWWRELRALYSGPLARDFFDTVESSFQIGEDILAHLDKIKIVRLLREANLNDTDMFCLDNVTLSDYVPDMTGALSRLKQNLCRPNRTALFSELPPLLFASQGYERKLKMSKDVNYTAVNTIIDEVLNKLRLIRNGPNIPRRPAWITEEKLQHLRGVTRNLFSKQTLTKIVFGTMSNVIDGVTLFMNSSDCGLCSPLTTWLRQITLQLIKKDEYDALLCHLPEMSLTDIYSALRNNFHWDMAIQELISQRNYTNFELNKALNQFLDQVSSQTLQALSANTSRLRQCWGGDMGDNVLGDVAFHLSIVSKTLRMIRSAVTHLDEIEGIKRNRFLVRLSESVAHRLPVTEPLAKLLVNASEFGRLVEVTFGNGSDLLKITENSMVDISKVHNHTTIPIFDWLSLRDGGLPNVCSRIHCSNLSNLIVNHLNTSDISKRLPALQASEFWRFRWVAAPLRHAGRLLDHAGGVLGVGSRLRLSGGGRVVTLLDALLTVLQEDNSREIINGLNGIIEELHPLLKDTELDFDLKSLSEGLRGLANLRDSIIERSNLSVEVRRLVAEPARLEREMRQLGVNDTEFWTVAAPALLAGSIQFKPLLTSKERSPHVSVYVCSPESAARLLRPAALSASERDVLGSFVAQFCEMDEAAVDKLLPVIMRSLNTTFIFGQMLDGVLLEVYRSSGLSKAEGERVLSRYRELVALAPAVQDNLANVSRLLAEEPLLAAFRDAHSVKDLLSSSEFLVHAGNMLCGKPLIADSNRFYKAIAETKDYSTEPDPEQLATLPSDFCRSLYTDILSMAGGKILWSFVKPLIMGKILFTPNTMPVHQIISRANSSFAGMSRMRDLVGGFSGAFASLDSLVHHRDSLVTMRELMSSERFRALAGALGGQDADDAGNLNFEGMFEQLGDVGTMGTMVKKLSELLGCVNLNRFVPAADEPQLTRTAVQLTALNEFSAGIVFVGDMHNPNNVEYKIRMDIENVPTTTRKRNQFWTPGPEASFIENMRYFRGFVQIQDLFDKAIVRRAHAHARTKRDVSARFEPDWAVYTQQMPYPCYKRDVFQSSLYESQALIVAFFFSLILTVSSAVRFAVHERETGNTMLMSVMGMRMSSHTTSWLVASLLEMLVTTTAMFLTLKLGGVLPHSDPFLLWLIIFNFGFSVVMFCYMVSKLFSSASLGSVCTSILYLMMFLPFVIVLAMEAVLSTAGKLFTCLSACTAFSYSVLHVARYEATGAGAQWSNVWRSPDTADTMSIASTTLIVLLDALLYAFVGWLVERFTEYKTHTDNLVNSTTSSEKAGVSIMNVSKVYTRGHKPLLDNVSVELHRGQVTTLLGHNGAGKTTLIKIIMGVLKPTSGNIVIRSEDAGGVKLGVCPQQDVLIENMTAAEHLQFYSILKSGGTSEDVELEVQNMLHVLSMGGLAYEQVRRLSGGLRRRLCVALAFVSSPQLVLLDEPSSGVDPVARRDIWSLIVKLKESRTVLLTTHHLDEAELLSDQIVIMHKGQVHTTGSPIEIKRSLGSGYKLTASYTKLPPAPPGHEDRDALGTVEEDFEHRAPSIEERSKELLTAVRTVAKNAQLLDVRGRDVEITLPFFDANGLNTDFLGVCELMESKQPQLEFTSYGMDCSSLEQVFLGICQQADSLQLPPADRVVDFSTASSTSSNESQAKASNASDLSTLVGSSRLAGTQWQQYGVLVRKRALHYRRSARLLALLLVLPTAFVLVAMGFSLIRPPADNEVALRLDPALYGDATQFLVPHPSYINGAVNTTRFADDVMAKLARSDLLTTEWKEKDNPHCECTSVRQECDYSEYNRTLPQLLTVPNTSVLLDWTTSTQEIYTEKRYGGWSAARVAGQPHLVAWYNNKGHHALPSYVSALSAAALRSASGDPAARLVAYTHPLKISHEQLSKSTLLQHVADVGIAGVILIGFSLIPAGAAVYLVTERVTQQKRLQLLCGVAPTTYWLAAITWDMLIILINIGLTVCVLEIFQLPVFVEKDNLPAICLLLLLFGWSCGCLVHVCEKLFNEASLANMLLFCANVFVGVSGLAVLLILDIISDSDFTDNARWTLHKLFLLSPQFALGDGLIEVAKNSIQAQVLRRFGMDTYRSPLTGGLLTHHYLALALVGTLLFLLNLAIENDWHEELLSRWRSSPSDLRDDSEMEELDVATERYRVELAAMRGRSVARPTHLHTIGNINAGFMNTEGKSVKLVKTASLPRTPAAAEGDVLQCLSLRKEYVGATGRRVAVHSLTLGIPPGQCLALLGENGAGKSSTFGMLTGELRPSAGQILLQEEPACSRQLCRGHISYCPQSDAVDALLSVREQLQFYCRLRGITPEHEVIRATLQLFELAQYAEQRTRTLSGGNRRKLCTAAALMGRSPLVLLDEPTSGMDPGARDVVRRAVAAACGAGRAVLLSTHALDDVRALAQRLALLQRGRLRTVAHVQQSLARWGGGWVVAVRTARGANAARVRDAVRARLSHAALHAQHCGTLQFLLPASTAGGSGGEEWPLSRVFRELAELQGQYEIEDFTINQSSLYQMFANFSDKDRTAPVPAPSSPDVPANPSNEELDSVTAL